LRCKFIVAFGLALGSCGPTAEQRQVEADQLQAQVDIQEIWLAQDVALGHTRRQKAEAVYDQVATLAMPTLTAGKERFVASSVKNGGD
jgi:hypothetical protein